MEKSPRVSVIMIAHNAALWVEEAIQSMLGQTVTDCEFIIFNDGSVDETDTCIRSFSDERLRYIHCTDTKGISIRSAQGLSIARGEYIARFDADATASPQRLAMQVAAFEKEPALAACATWCDTISSGAEPRARCFHPEETPAEIVLSFLKGQNPCVTSATMLRKSAVLAAGGFDERVGVGGDFDLLVRLVLQGGVLEILQHPLTTKRSHAEPRSPRGAAERNKSINRLYAGLGAADPFQSVLVRAFFDSAQKCIDILDQNTWPVLCETVQTLYCSLAALYPERPEYADRLCDETERCLQRLQDLMKSFLRLQEKLSDKDFARRLPPERKIKIEELCAVYECMRDLEFRDLIRNARSEAYV